MKLEGIHHITAITENAQRNVDHAHGKQVGGDAPAHVAQIGGTRGQRRVVQRLETGMLALTANGVDEIEKLRGREGARRITDGRDRN